MEIGVDPATEGLRHMRRVSITFAALMLTVGCQGGRDDGSGTDDVLTTLPTGGDGDGDGEKYDVGGGEGTGPGDEKDDCDPALLPDPNSVLTGTVFAPNMEIPISGALVYLTDDPVEPVPDEVYCAECVKIPCDSHYVLTEPDGSFELPAVAGPGQSLVVQKGQFLHVVPFDVSEGSNLVQPAQSNLPGQWNPGAGEWIPRIAVYETYPDEVFNVLAKFGMGSVDASGTLIPGTEEFDLIADSDQGTFMDSLANMSQYHIIFVPCATTKYWTGAPTVPQSRADNIRDYVEAGGKWYATDHSNEYIKEPFPSYQDFHAPTMPDIQPAYDVDGTVLDPELLAWLTALPDPLKNIGSGNATLLTLPIINLRLNYSGIEAVYDIYVQNQDGEDVNVGHHTWVEGPCTSCSNSQSIRPMAISGMWGCGRMMYSTFENSSMAHNGLNPQELVLLYMILEIGACHSVPPPPPPPVG
jgi:hypothetical protein